jgi:indolepyruvate decarboxylase
MYAGRLMNGEVREFVESCDVVINVGTLLSDLNTGAFTARLDPARVISIGHHQTTICGKTFFGVEMADLLAALAGRLKKQERAIPRRSASVDSVSGRASDPITAAALYPRWGQFLRETDIVVAETSTVSMGLAFARLPRATSFYNQGLWGSIGWATPAALGAAVAAPHRRVLLLTGEGAHQFTVQELGQFCRLGLNPIIFVLNNGGYLIERLLGKDPAAAYNDIAPWRYSELPRVLGCDGWMTARVTSCGELDQALQHAATAETGVYIEVVTPPDGAPPFALRLKESTQSLYRSQ